MRIATMRVETSVAEGILKYAPTISSGPLLSSEHRPEPWAFPRRCFENVGEKISRDGGSGLCGWTFQVRAADGLGPYLIAIHHAIWLAPDNAPVDVTPFDPLPEHCFVIDSGRVVFLVDEQARPVVRAGSSVGIVLPTRFFPLVDDARLLEYTESLQREMNGQFEREINKTR